MPNAYLDRESVHGWIDDIDQNKAGHKPALKLLLSKQRVLVRYVNDGIAAIGLERRSTVMFITGAFYGAMDAGIYKKGDPSPTAPMTELRREQLG